MPEEASPVELIAELHRRQGEMYAGGAVSLRFELCGAEFFETGPAERSPPLRTRICQAAGRTYSPWIDGARHEEKPS